MIRWLVFQSLYIIGALCPYCMVVWAVVIPLFWYVTARNVAAGALGAAPDGRLADGLRDWRGPLVFGTYLVVLLLVLERFWSYWSTLLLRTAGQPGLHLVDAVASGPRWV